MSKGYSPQIQTFIDEYKRLTGKEPNSRLMSIAFNEILLPSGQRDPLEVAQQYATDPVMAAVWYDPDKEMVGLVRSGDDYIIRVDPTTDFRHIVDVDMYIPDYATVYARRDRLYLGNLIVDDEQGSQAVYRVLGINPLAVMNRLVRQARVLGLTEKRIA